MDVLLCSWTTYFSSLITWSTPTYRIQSTTCCPFWGVGLIDINLFADEFIYLFLKNSHHFVCSYCILVDFFIRLRSITWLLNTINFIMQHLRLKTIFDLHILWGYLMKMMYFSVQLQQVVIYCYVFILYLSDIKSTPY